ncbi:MAG: thiamine phosphate synthase [Terriglobales bacterium]
MLLYYITDRSQFPGDESSRRKSLLEKVAEAAKCGVDFIQLREKDLSAPELESFANSALDAVRPNSSERDHRTRLLINSRTDVAIACRADGVHLRSHDVPPNDVRQVWSQATPASLLISVACHTVKEVALAYENGADFAIFGPVFEKIDAGFEGGPAGLNGLGKACNRKIPVIALGGVTMENAAGCLAAGAVGIAGIRLFQQNPMGQVVQDLRGSRRPRLGK